MWTVVAALPLVVMACAVGDDLGRATGAHSEADAGPPPEPPQQGCTYTQGYWKNHPDAWPLTSLTLGSRSYDQGQLLELLGTPPRGDASMILAHQLIAALLNAAAASGDPAIGAAQTWMSLFDPGHPLPYGVRAGSFAGEMATELADDLADYNEGTTGPGHCDED